MTPRDSCTPSSRARPRRILEAAAVALIAASCARVAPPPPDVLRRALALRSYSARLQVSVRGPELRGRSRALVAFRRPDALRIEIPGPTGVRLVAVARGGTLTAVLPAERAVLQGPAEREELGALVGVALAPGELMDLLVGAAPRDLRRHDVRWGRTLPSRIEAVLADGTLVRATVDEADLGEDLPAAAFDPPLHDGYRRIDAEEARRLLGGR